MNHQGKHVIFFFSLKRLCIFVSIFILSACGGGSGGSTPTSTLPTTTTSTTTTTPTLTGQWMGTLEDPIGDLKVLVVSISGTTATATLDGASTGLTYTITYVQDQIFGVEASDGTVGGFYTDASMSYMAYADEDFNIAVLEKNATTLPSYELGDIHTVWTGIEIYVDADFDFLQSINSSVTVDVDGTFSGSNDSGDTFTQATGGEIELLNANYGLYSGDYINNTLETGRIIGLLSPDKQFLTAYACPGPGSYPDGCSLTAWRR